MSMSEASGLYGLGQGCPLHGDEYMRECGLCGCEYCRSCHRGVVCPDCAAESEEASLDDEPESSPDFEDVKNVDALLGEDKEAERILKDDEDLIPPEDLVYDEDEGEKG